MATLHLPGGGVFTGTPEQCADLAIRLGIAKDASLFYNSSTHGPVLITSMETTHLMNAIRKLEREWAENLKSYNTPLELLSALRNGNTDKTFVALITELTKRIVTK